MDRRTHSYLEKLIRQIDPHFAEPIYFVSRREARAAGILEAQEYCGLTSIGMAGDCRALLERQGRWRGRGFCAVIDLTEIETTRGVESVALHEFAHYCESSAQTANLEEAMGRAAFDAALSEPSKIVGTERPEPTRDELQTMHGPAFIRLCSHIEQRAVWALNRWPATVCPERYSLPLMWRWRAALGNEPRQLADWPLISVAAMCPPKSYEQFSAATLAAQ